MREYSYFDVYFMSKKDEIFPEKYVKIPVRNGFIYIGFCHKILKRKNKEEVIDYMKNLGYEEEEIAIFEREN